jgi:hypothetical protein
MFVSESSSRIVFEVNMFRLNSLKYGSLSNATHKPTVSPKLPLLSSQIRARGGAEGTFTKLYLELLLRSRLTRNGRYNHSHLYLKAKPSYQ